MSAEAINEDYSLDMIKRAAFFYELSSLRIRSTEQTTNNQIISIAEYLENRLEEIDRKYKTQR